MTPAERALFTELTTEIRALTDVVKRLTRWPGAESMVAIEPSFRGGNAHDVRVTVYASAGEPLSQAGNKALEEFRRLQAELQRLENGVHAADSTS
jgi:hypothetical protein